MGQQIHNLYLTIKCCSDLISFFPPHLFPTGFFPAHESLPARSKDKSRLIVCRESGSHPALSWTPFLAPRRQNAFHPARRSGPCYTPILGRALKGVVPGPPISLWHLAADLSTDSTLGWFLPRVIFNLELFTQSLLFLRHPVEPRDTKVNIKGGPNV